MVNRLKLIHGVFQVAYLFIVVIVVNILLCNFQNHEIQLHNLGSVLINREGTAKDIRVRHTSDFTFHRQFEAISVRH